MGVKEQYRDYVMTGFVKRVEPVVADHGDGALLYDADGTEYIDCFAGISVTNAGHHNQQILDAAIAQANKLVHACSLRVPRRIGRRARREARRGHPRRPAEDLLRQRWRRGHRGRVPPRQALQRQERVPRHRVELPRPLVRDSLGDRQLRPQEGRRPLHAGRRLRAHAVLLPLLRRDHARQVRHALRAPRRRDRPPAPQRQRLRLHRRAGDGRGRHHRAAGRLLQARQGDPRRAGASCSSPTRSRAGSAAPASSSPSSTTASCRTS